MAYEPLALKYRPSHFADLVGQEATTATLRNALKSERVANAFLFSGSRGVGKTSCARIFAKALNCPDAADGESCGKCPMCEGIARGDDLDVIEIDGASNRGIDEIRTIRDNAGYAPARGRYKIYIIDEVHMLTIQAFNALLKTLEEPPPHVKFIFATTEIQAVPETILSRCQRYEFRRISPGDIVKRLVHICEREGVSAQDGVLQEIAAKAEGGLRDSVSLLDQIVSFAGEQVTLEDLDRVLGLVDSELLGSLLVHAADGEPGPLLDVLDQIFETGRDPEEVLSQVVEILREAMVREARGLPGGGEGRRAALIADVRDRLNLDRVLFALRVCLNARREMKLVGQGRLQLELSLLKIARSRDLVPLAEIVERLRGGAAPRAEDGPGRPSGSGPAGGRPAGLGDPAGRRWSPPEPPAGGDAAARGARDPSGEKRGDTGPPPSTKTASSSLEKMRSEWGKIMAVVRKRSRQTGAYLEGGMLESLAGSKLTVLLPAGQTFAKKQLEGEAGKVVAQVLNAHLGSSLTLEWEVAREEKDGSSPQPRTTVYEDREVRKILDNFEGIVMSVENEDQP